MWKVDSRGCVALMRYAWKETWGICMMLPLCGAGWYDCDITKKGQSDQARVPRTQVKRDHLRPEGKPPSPHGMDANYN